MAIKFSKYTDKIINSDKVVIINTVNGYFIRISKEVFDILNYIMENHMENELTSILLCDEDREYINDLIHRLINNKVIIKNNKEIDLRNKIVSIELTHRCNLNCKHCCISAAFTDDKSIDLSTTKVKEMLDKLIEWNPERISVSGGEPMYRDDFIEISEYLRKYYKGKIELCTNGLLINDNNISILKNNYDVINISIDGVDEESCSKVRGKGVFDKVIENIKKLKEHNIEKITLSMAVSDKNEELESKFIELNESLGTSPLIRNFAPVGRGKENKSLFTDIDDDKVYIPDSYLNDKKIYIRTCTAGKHELFIDYKGDVYPCPSFNSKEYLMGNILEENSVYDITNKFNANLMKSSSIIYKKCRDCNVNYFCWTCPGEIERLKDNEKAIDYRCKVLKPILTEKIWGDD